MRPAKRSIVAVGLLGAALFGTAAPASAATFLVEHGANTAVTSLDDKEVTLCDGEDDNLGVQVKYVRASGNSGAFWEKRGVGACATSGSGTVIVRMQICEQRPRGADSCTAWKDNPNLGFAPIKITEEDLRREAEDPYMNR
ncbi:hypothetical protein ABT294_43070 [Nonomuraea sp. NPDC000554]|uniref:hypothetical protein n=1 Tax=Nonomuraea sp. NPDC000554 TaxID=3154259 RepID=UPI00331D94C7